jgi:hypothetical protein
MLSNALFLVVMTIAIGINFGTYVLLAADTRATCYSLDPNVKKDHEDDKEKIYCTNIGIVSGVGSVELLEPVNARFNEIDKVSSLDLLKKIVAEERRRFPIRFPRVPDEYAEQVKNTWWIFSYRQVNYEKGELTLELGIIDPLEKLGLLDKKNHPYVLPAFGATKQDWLDIMASLKDLTKPYEEFESLEESIEYHWKNIHTLIQEISFRFSSINSFSQVGFCTIDGFQSKSPIAKIVEDIPPMTKKLMAAPC